MFKGSLSYRIDDKDVLKEVTEYEVYKFYFPDYEPGNGCTHSPLRQDDIPSFGIFYANRYSRWLHKDLSTGEIGTCFTFVRDLFGYTSYTDAVMRVAADFGLIDKFVKRPKIKPSRAYSTNKEITINIIEKDFDSDDLEYWNTFNVDKYTLDTFNVKSVKSVILSSGFSTWSVVLDKYAYAYPELKDGKNCYKIYQPFVDKRRKWINNYKTGTHSGYEQLPSTDELLIITKSMKDVMSIYNTLGIPAIAVQSEGSYIKDEVFAEYKIRFKHMRLLFDNDEAGIKTALLYKERYGIDLIVIPDEYPKDYSDIVKELGIEQAKQILIDLI